MQQLSAESKTGERVFARVLVGIDGSDAGREAAARAGRLVAPGGTLEPAMATYLIDANLQHWQEEEIEATLEGESRPSPTEAAAAAGPRATTRLLNGPSLIAVPTHEHSRLSGLPIGGVYAGAESDLVIVGSRGLHGLATVGSVSEHVAYRAHSAVLVVRTQPTSACREPAWRS